MGKLKNTTTSLPLPTHPHDTRIQNVKGCSYLKGETISCINEVIDAVYIRGSYVYFISSPKTIYGCIVARTI